MLLLKSKSAKWRSFPFSFSKAVQLASALPCTIHLFQNWLDHSSKHKNVLYKCPIRKKRFPWACLAEPKLDMMNPSSCACCTVRPDRNFRVWNRERFIAKIKQGELATCAPETELPDGFQGRDLKANLGGRVAGCVTSFWLVDGEVTGWSSQNLNSAAFWLWPVWGPVLCSA